MRLVALLSFILIASTVQSQSLDNPIKNRGYYRTSLSGGAFLHTSGLGVQFRKTWRVTGYVNKVMNFELLNMKHPKEFKSYNPVLEDTKGFFYGKVNSLFLLRPSFGWQKTLFNKDIKKGVQVSYTFLFGPSLGFAKPIYLEVWYPSIYEREFLAVERYDIDRHTTENILGRASFVHGLDQIRVYPGLHAKLAFEFEYSPDDEMIKALTVGANFDAFGKEIPIMATTYNNQFFVTLHIGFMLGRRYL